MRRGASEKFERFAAIRARVAGVAKPKGENVVIITGAGGSGVLLSDACVDNGLSLMKMPPDLDSGFRKFIPPRRRRQSR